jgi:hypothetical protein
LFVCLFVCAQRFASASQPTVAWCGAAWHGVARRMGSSGAARFGFGRRCHISAASLSSPLPDLRPRRDRTLGVLARVGADHRSAVESDGPARLAFSDAARHTAEHATTTRHDATRGNTAYNQLQPPLQCGLTLPTYTHPSLPRARCTAHAAARLSSRAERMLFGSSGAAGTHRGRGRAAARVPLAPQWLTSERCMRRRCGRCCARSARTSSRCASRRRRTEPSMPAACGQWVAYLPEGLTHPVQPPCGVPIRCTGGVCCCRTLCHSLAACPPVLGVGGTRARRIPCRQLVLAQCIA